MSKLDSQQRANLPASDFAGPDRSYPIPDENHARNALSRVSQNGSPQLQQQVNAKVSSKFSRIGSTTQQ